MTTQFTGGSTSNLDALSVAGATTLSGTTTFGTAPMATPSGSAPVYGCRAWCVFDGTLTGTNAPTSGGNVTSVTRISAGQYTVNLTTAMPDVNYCVVANARMNTVASFAIPVGASNTTSSAFIQAINNSMALADANYVYVAIFR